MKIESIEKYQEILRKDPNSQVFAALADAYRELGLIDQAEKVARHGIQRHPSYVSGFVALGRILMAKESWKDAEFSLSKATSLSPENILAHQLLGQIYLAGNRPAEALRAYKMVLFLNPRHEKALKAVEKLETVSALEFDEDIFQMKNLSQKPGAAKNSSVSFGSAPEDLAKLRERKLSLIDAHIVRNELGMAREQLHESARLFPGDPGFAQRWEIVGESSQAEEAPTLHPDLKRENYIRDRKLQRLESVLHRIRSVSPSVN